MARGDREWLERERAALISHIEAAFRHVSREGGVSWSEADVIDDCGDDEERANARRADRDGHWMQLVDDPAWALSVMGGGFAFLDAIGFRYYLPAAMVRCLYTHEHQKPTDDCSECVMRALQVVTDSERERCSLLDLEQRRVIHRFIEYMEARDRAHGDEFGNDEWRFASRYWAKGLGA